MGLFKFSTLLIKMNEFKPIFLLYLITISFTFDAFEIEKLGCDLNNGAA